MLSNSYIEINVDNYRHNINYLKEISSKNLIGIIKANAYGAVDFKCAKILESEGVNFFGVSSILEAISLRHHDIKGNILILGYVDPHDLYLAHKYDLSISTISLDYIKEIINYDIKDLKVHLKIDTGMNRIGLFKDEVLKALNLLLEHKANVEGIFTHYACSDNDDNFTYQQYLKFKDVVNLLNYDFKYIHTSNTDATIHFRDEISNYVRCGLGLLGYSSYHTDLKPCVSLYSKVINTKLAKANSGVSYGQHYKLEKDEYISTIAIGYADGLLRAYTGNMVYVDGEYAKIVGSICMDQMMVVSSKPLKLGSKVEIFGEHVDIHDIANQLDTIIYEVLTNLSDRLSRAYINNNHEIIDIFNNRFKEI